MSENDTIGKRLSFETWGAEQDPDGSTDAVGKAKKLNNRKEEKKARKARAQNTAEEARSGALELIAPAKPQVDDSNEKTVKIEEPTHMIGPRGHICICRKCKFYADPNGQQRCNLKEEDCAICEALNKAVNKRIVENDMRRENEIETLKDEHKMEMEDLKEAHRLQLLDALHVKEEDRLGILNERFEELSERRRQRHTAQLKAELNQAYETMGQKQKELKAAKQTYEDSEARRKQLEAAILQATPFQHHLKVVEKGKKKQ